MKTIVRRAAAEVYDLDHVELRLLVDRSACAELPDLTKPMTLELKKSRRKRSLNANAFFWSICGKIAEKVKTSKDEVYRKAIKEAGVWEIYGGPQKALKRLAKTWETNGEGYQSAMLDSGSLMLFYGSSSYDSKEMSRLIDWVVDEAEGMGIDTSTPQERALLLEEWRQEHG